MPQRTYLSAVKSLQLTSDFARVVCDHLRETGHTYTFSIVSDSILCQETQGCYAADLFEVESIHAFGPVGPSRELLYAIRFEDGEKGLIMATSRDLEGIDEPTLYSKLLIL